MKKVVAALIALIISFTSVYSYSAKAESVLTDNIYMYTFTRPADFTVINTPDSENPILELTDSNNRITSKISFDKIDQNVIQSTRDYISDYSSSDTDIFKYMAAYKDSFFKAVAESTEKNFLYGSEEISSEEPYIKIIESSKENLYGTDSYVNLYNIIENVSGSVYESTNLSIMVPSLKNQIIYTFNFSMIKGNLDYESINSILRILNSFKVTNHDITAIVPGVLNNTEAINKANQGIYPGVEGIALQYNYLENETAGYKIKYPSTFVPYKKNNFLDSIQYTSFKITANDVFSLTAEKTLTEGNIVQDRINSLVIKNGSELKITDAGIDLLGDKHAIYINYCLDNNGSRIYAKEYYIKSNSMLYTFRLLSNYAYPSEKVSEEFLNILDSAEFTIPIKSSTVNTEYKSFYNNIQKDFVFMFPSTWEISYPSVGDAAYLKIKNPAVSSSFEIRVIENDMLNETSYENTLKLSSETGSDYGRSFKNNIVYCTQSPLTWTFSYSDGIGRVMKLENYMDENGRARVTGTIIITRGKKAYTMYINMSEYSVTGMKSIDPGLLAEINAIAESFALK